MDVTPSLPARTCAARAAIVLLFLLPGVAGGQPADDAGLSIHTLVGFEDRFTPGRWTPVTVTVHNRGRDLAGHLEVRSTHGDALAGELYTVAQRKPLQLTRDSSKRLQFTVLLENPSRPLVVRITAGDEELARRSIELRRRFMNGSGILVLSPSADLDYLNNGDGVRVLYAHPELLPERWQGYDALHAVILHGISLERLGARQYEALRRWLASGGTLVVSGGANYSLLRTPRLAALLPATPGALVQITDTAAVGEAFAVPLDTAPFHVNRLTRISGRVLHGAAGRPLVVERSDGRGRVLLLSFDLTRAPFDRWPGMKQLLPQLLQLSRTPALPGYRDRADEDAIESLLSERATPFPGHATVLYFVAFYLALIATGARLRPGPGRGRRLLPWMTWVAPLVFAPAAWLLFGPVLFPKGVSVVAVSVVEPFPDSPYASARLSLGLYANHARALSLTYEGIAPAFRVRSRPGVQAASWTLDDEVPPSMQVDERRSYVLHGLDGHDVIPFKLSVSVRRDERGATLELRNDTGRRLRQVWLLLDGQGYSLGTLQEEAVVSRRLDAAAAVELWGEAPWRVLEHSRTPQDVHLKTTRILMERVLAAAEERPQRGPPGALLIGYVGTPLRAVGGGPRMEELALVVAPVRVESRPGAGRRDALRPDPS